MEFIQSLNLMSAVELSIVAVICSLFTQAVKELDVVDTKYMPFISMLFGVIIAVAVSVIFKDVGIGQAIIAGILIGGFTAGLFTGIKGITGGYDTHENAGGESKNEA